MTTYERSISQISTTIRSGLKAFIKEFRTRSHVRITGANYHDVPRADLLVLLLFLIGNKRVTFQPNNDSQSSQTVRLTDTPLILLRLLSEGVLLLTLPIAYLFVLVTYSRIKTTSTLRSFSRKSILYLRTDFLSYHRTGGSFTHVNGFISGAKKLRWKTTLATSASFSTPADEVIITPYVRTTNFRTEIAEMLYSAKLIAALKKESPYSVIYQRHSGFDITGLILSARWRCPLILEVNNLEFWIRKNWGTIHFAWLLKLAERILFAKAHTIVVVSDVLKEDLISFGVSENKILVNPNGVDTDHFTPEASCALKPMSSKKETTVGFIGSFGVWHGVTVLAEAIPIVLKKRPNIRFLFIGDGVLRSEIESKLSDYTKTERVFFTGLVSHEEAPHYLACCDILASPHVPNQDGSRFFGSPTKLFEYMAMGKSIIASDLEQIGEILEHNKTALLVTPANAKKLAEGILKLVDTPELRESLGQNAREVAIKKHTWKQNAAQVLSRLDT